MIDIQYDPVATRVKLKGHAGAGVQGQDLICCAVSILTYALAANVRRMHSSGWLKQAKIRLAPGDADISCRSSREHRQQVEQRMDALCLGYSILAREYPDFVRFQIKHKEGNLDGERSA